MAASMMAMRSLRSPALLGSTMDLMATMEPRQMPLYTLPNCGSKVQHAQSRTTSESYLLMPYCRWPSSDAEPTTKGSCLDAESPHRAFPQWLQQLHVLPRNAVVRCTGRTVVSHNLLPHTVHQLRHGLLPRLRKRPQRS